MDCISICKAANYLFNFQLVAFNIKKKQYRDQQGLTVVLAKVLFVYDDSAYV